MHPPFLRIALIAALAVGPAASAHGPEHKTAEASQTVKISVTEDGFVPERVKVKKGSPVTLVITRKTNATCAKEIVVAGEGIKRALPLNEPVTITVHPSKTGEIKYACGMDMVSGVILVE